MTRYTAIVVLVPRVLIAMLGLAGCAMPCSGSDTATRPRSTRRSTPAPMRHPMPSRCGCGSGHDEDGDRYADNCDPCPSDFGDRTDTDGDGVGDACDPNPTTPGDSIVWFESFATPDEVWTQSSGSWQFGSDAFVAVPNSNAERASAVGNSTVEVWLDDFAAAADGGAGVALDFGGNATAYAASSCKAATACSSHSRMSMAASRRRPTCPAAARCGSARPTLPTGRRR